MLNALLFALCTLIWGSTWYVITFQLGSVPEEWSVAWRFGLAGLVLLGYCAVRRRRMRFALRDHATFAGLGALLFSINYVFTYWGTGYLTSGLVAVVFSTMTLTNILNGAVFLGQRIEPRVLAGAMLGLGGVALVFLPEIERLSLSSATLVGVLFSLAATLCASFGNTLAASPRAKLLPTLQFNGYGMLYGAILIGLIALAQGKPPAFEWSAGYLWSLAYLAVLGSIVAFTIYLRLLKDLGIGRAAYMAVIIPVVALGVSTLFEGYRWTVEAGLGVALVAAGNLLLIRRRRPPKVETPRSTHTVGAR